MAKQLDCTISIASTQNNGIHGIHSSQHTTFNLLNHLANKTKTSIDQHLRHGLDHFKIESFQSADALQKALAEINFGLGDDSGIEDHSHVFGTLFYKDIFKCIQFLLAHLPFQAHLDFDRVRLADLECLQIYSKINTGDWWWDT